MAKTMYFTNGWPSTHRGDDDNNLAGAAKWWEPHALSESRGSDTTGTVYADVNTVAGPTNGVEFGPVSSPFEWLSEPLSADFTIAGTITVNLWGYENSMSANAAINVIVDKIVGANGNVVQIAKSAFTTELGLTTPAAYNFTVTPTSMLCYRGDRIRVRVFIDDAGTMGTGYQCYFYFSRSTGGVAGDSYITFTENLTFEAAGNPPGSTYYLTNTNETINPGSAIEKKALTTRGAASVVAVTGTIAGPTAGVQITSSGTEIEWYTPALQAFTLGGKAKFAMQAWQAVRYYASLKCEIAICDTDGTNPVVWGVADVEATPVGSYAAGELNSTTYSVVNAWVSGDDTAVADGKRLRFRIYVDDCSTIPLASGGTVSFAYNGLAGGNGDTYVILPQTVTEQAGGTRAIVGGAFSGVSSVSGAVTAKKVIAAGAIIATSSVSGLVGRIRKITSGVITGSSSISGGPRAIRAIRSGVVTGVSSISGVLSKIVIKPIPGGVITGTSSVSGGIRAFRRITGVITGTGTFSGIVGVIRKLVFGGITGTSSVSGGIRALRAIRLGQIVGTSSISAVVGVRRPLAVSQIFGISSISGAVKPLRAIRSGVITGTSSFSGFIGVLRGIMPSGITGTSSVSGVLSKITGVSYKAIVGGAFVGSSTFTGGVRKLAAIAGAVTAISGISGAVRAYRRVTGAITATSSISGSLSKGGWKPLTVSGITATSTLSGGIRVIRGIAGVITGTSAVSGSIRAFRRISGIITGTSVVSGSVAVRRRITGGITATSSISAFLTKLGTAPILGGAIQAVSTFAGIVGVRRKLVLGNILGISSISGGIRALRRITGAISAVSSFTATVQRLRPITPSAIVGTSSFTSSIARIVHLIGTINSTSTISGHVVVRYAITGGQISAQSSISGALIKQGGIFGNILATSTISGSIRLGYTVWGREIPQLTSAAYAKPEILSADTGTTKLIEVT